MTSLVLGDLILLDSLTPKCESTLRKISMNIRYPPKKYTYNTIYYELKKMVNTKVLFFFKFKLPSSTKTQQDLFFKRRTEQHYFEL
jgi:hypothetical protein